MKRTEGGREGLAVGSRKFFVVLGMGRGERGKRVEESWRLKAYLEVRSLRTGHLAVGPGLPVGRRVDTTAEMAGGPGWGKGQVM